MKIFVLRHGMTSNADEDADRELTPHGIKEVTQVLGVRLEDLASVMHIYSSPLLRVRQTLDIAARMMNFQGAIQETNNLKTGSRLPEIKNFLNDLDFDGGDILFSSHQSCTSILILWLTGRDALIPNGSLLCLDVKSPEQGAGKLLWQQSRDGSHIKDSSNSANFADFT